MTSSGTGAPTPPQSSIADWEAAPSRAVLPPMQAQLRGAVLLVPIALLSLGPHLALWGIPDPVFPKDIGSALLFIAAFAVGTLLHEGLHGLGHTLGQASWDDIEFGMNWEALTPFAHCLVPARAHSYRIAVALPGIVLGVVPLGVGLFTGSWLVSFFAFLMLVAAAGDILVLFILRSIPGDMWVQDHPTAVGCLVVAPAGSSAPPRVSADDLPDEEEAHREGISIRLVALLMAVSAVFAAVGFMMAVT